MAAELAKDLLEQDKIDLVLCFAPSRQVVEGFRRTFFGVLGRRMDGLIGAVGAACTYQGMEYRDEAFWNLFDDYRVFAIFDEIHHCAGHDALLSNAWGQRIIQRVQDRAECTLALSGTPWRSDQKAIVLARYSNPEGHLICDYQYGLAEAISDQVCRSPRIVILDNQMVSLTEALASENTVTMFPNIASLLTGSPVSYESLLLHEDVLRQLLVLGCRKLKEIREVKADAGGLVVATNIEHAHQIAAMLLHEGETCEVVTNKTPNAQQVIDDFRRSSSPWIVAVGMISEGTDIPRLQVCCHLSRIRTELYYRQVLGRILRRSVNLDTEAWLYVLAEPSLQQFSERVANDLPDDHAVISLVRGFSSPIDSSSADVGDERLSLGSVVPFGLRHADAEGQRSSGQIIDYKMGPGYELSFSQHYRTQLLRIC
jgi:superfamily II DNA or RNA helicase